MSQKIFNVNKQIFNHLLLSMFDQYFNNKFKA
jgi:hypothetical protein